MRSNKGDGRQLDVIEETPLSSEELDLLLLCVSGERYGIETSHVLGVIPLGGLRLGAGTSPFVLGVVTHGGGLFRLWTSKGCLRRKGDESRTGARSWWWKPRG